MIEQRNGELADRVARSIRELGYRELNRVTCQVDKGWVVLTGTAGSYYLKQIAQTIAAKVPGVRGVRNDLKVV